MWGDYSTLVNLKLELGIGDTGDDARYQRIITAASRHVDHWTFQPDFFYVGRAGVRVFDIPETLYGPLTWMPESGLNASGSPFVGLSGSSQPTLLGFLNSALAHVTIDALMLPPEEVAVDTNRDGTYADTLTYLTDYDLLPINAQQTNRPFTTLRGLGPTAKIKLPVGPRALRIKGLWGFQAPNSTLQTLQITGQPAGGTFTLSYGGYTTAALAYDASGSDVALALLALPSLAHLASLFPGMSALEVSDGVLTQETLNIITSALIGQITIGANNLTGGTAPTPVVSALSYTSPSYPADIEEAVLLTCTRWIKLPSTAPLGALGTVELGHMRVQPSQDVIDILTKGNWIDSWVFA